MVSSHVLICFLEEGCLNKSLVGQEMILLHSTRLCTEVPVVIRFKQLHLAAKHKHKPVTIEMLYLCKINSS